MNLHVLSLVSCDDVVHGPDIAAGVQFDGVSWFDLDRRNSLHFRTDVVCADSPEGVHHIGAAVQAEDLFLGIPNRDFASLLDVIGAGQVEWSNTRFGQVGEEDIPPLEKVGSPILMQFCRLDKESVWYNFECLTVIMLLILTSWVTQTLPEKLKWTGRGGNLYNGIRL